MSKECCICFEEYINEILLDCGHSFHKECIDVWLIENLICPLCRKVVKHDHVDYEDIIEEPADVPNSMFSVKYKPFTNFAMESISQPISSTPDFGKTVSFTIPRYGDFVHPPIVIKLPAIKKIDSLPKPSNVSWVNKLGHSLIKSVEVEIGGSQIDKQYGEWLDVWKELTDNPSEKSSVKSTNNVGKKKKRHHKKFMYNH